MRKFEMLKNAPEMSKKLTRGTVGSAGYDIVCPYDVTIMPGACSELIPLGWTAYMNPGEQLVIVVRSSAATTSKATATKPRSHLIVAQGSAIIDQDYAPNEVKLMLHNFDSEPRHIKAGDKIAQAIFMPFLVTDDDECTQERQGGFGSTGVN